MNKVEEYSPLVLYFLTQIVLSEMDFSSFASLDHPYVVEDIP